MSDPQSTVPRPRSLVERYLRLDPVERRRSFLSTREAARSIGVAQRTLQAWVGEGKLEAIRVGGRYLIEVSTLECFIRNAMDDG
jgi:excisionase family DNA binding protein